jgi:UDP-N-acetylglucosamine acyltransferase
MRGGFHPATWCDEISEASIEIGSRNVIREFATVHSGTTEVTRIANDCYLMTQAHVPHDAQIEDEVTLSNSSQLGGHTIIQRGANIGLGVVIHQHSLVGTRAMIGMGSIVTKDVPPYAMAYGSPAKVRGGNLIGMQRAGVDADLISKVVEALNSSDLNALRQLIPAEMRHFDLGGSNQKH